MNRCADCGGPVPAEATNCPNCAGREGSGSRTWKIVGLASLAGAGIASVTLMACYGGPCVAGSDGGRDCYGPLNEDAGTIVIVDDGGTNAGNGDH